MLPRVTQNTVRSVIQGVDHLIFERGRSFKGDFKKHNLQACLYETKFMHMSRKKNVSLQKKNTMDA